MRKYCFAIFAVKVTMKAHTIEYDCFYRIYLTADPFATKFVGWYIIISWTILCKDWMAVVKVTVKVQSVTESLSILQFLYKLYLCNQTRRVNVILLITKHVQAKLSYADTADSNTVTVLLGTQWGRRQTLFSFESWYAKDASVRGKETLSFTSTETIKAYQGRGSWGGGGREFLYLTPTHYTVTTKMILH